MACGTPVVTSFNSSLPEVVGDGGILVDPHNVVDISETIKSILGDSGLRERLIKNGLKRADNFTWEKCAKETLDFLKNV